MNKFCGHCGNPINIDDNFCGICGETLNSEEELSFKEVSDYNEPNSYEESLGFSGSFDIDESCFEKSLRVTKRNHCSINESNRKKLLLIITGN